MQELAGEWKRRLLDAIAHEAYRHSSEAEVARRADLHPRFLSQARKRGRIQLDQALALIAALGRDPGDFIARTLGQPLPAPTPQFRTASTLPDFVRRAYDRAQSQLPATIPKSHLEHLSQQRESNPRRVLQALEASLDHVASEDVPFALGIWSTLKRLQLDYPAAEQAIASGLELAENDLDQQGELLLKREALVKRRTLDWQAGDRIAIQVSELAVESGNTLLLGQSLVARMINARLQRDLHRATALGEQSLRLLPDASHRFVLFASLELAMNYARQGRAPDSRLTLQSLAGHHRPRTPWEETWYRWFEAGIADALGDHAAAERAMPSIHLALLNLDPEKATDAALDQAIYIARQGERERSIRTLRHRLDQSLGGILDAVELGQALEELPSEIDVENYESVRRRLYRRIQAARSVRPDGPPTEAP